MSFFDDPIPAPPREPRAEQPVWAGPPKGVLPGFSAQRAVLFRTDQIFLFVDRFLAYPNGIEFTVSLWLREPDDELADPPWGPLQHRRHPEPPPDDFVRFGVLLSDGAKWTNLDWDHPIRGRELARPVVMSRGGSGGDGSWHMDYWMWPLPPEGPLTFVASWPAQNIEEHSEQIGATEIRARASEAVVIWEL